MDGDAVARRGALGAPFIGFTPREELHLTSSADVDLSASREFCVSVSNEMVGSALSFVGSNGGWTPRRTVGAHTFIVTDVPPARSAVSCRRCILVLESSPFAAQLALRSLSMGRVMAAFTMDEPRHLVPALESLRSRYAMVPASVFELAASMPEMSNRQLDILGALTAGQSNRDIAKSVYLSEASVKREIAVLFQLFAVTSRLALAARARELGIRQRRPLT